MSRNPSASFAQASFDTLRDQLHGDLAMPGERGYQLARPWNLATTSRPAAVLIAANVDDVRHGVRWAAAHGMRVAVHATGHGSVGQDGDVLVIHTGLLTRCVVDPARRIARLDAGVVAQQLVDAADGFGLTPPIGSSGTVGVVGYLSGGGIGPLVSTFGLSSDHVRTLDVVTADGGLHRARAEENPDLYWAMRGGKAAVGVITAVELELLDLRTLYGGTLYFAAFDAADVLRAWARWSARLPGVATTSLALTNMPDDPSLPERLANRFVAAVRFATPVGSEDAEALLAEMRRAAAPIVDTMGTTSYRDLVAAHGGPTEPLPVHQDQRLLTSLGPETVDAILDAAGPRSGSQLTEVELRRLGGVLARQPRHASAFSHRESPYSLGVTAVLSGSEASTVASTEQLFAAVGPWTSGATLANFVDTVDPARIARSYDAHTVDRMRAVAERYDPRGVFAASGELKRIDT